MLAKKRLIQEEADYMKRFQLNLLVLASIAFSLATLPLTVPAIAQDAGATGTTTAPGTTGGATTPGTDTTGGTTTAPGTTPGGTAPGTTTIPDSDATTGDTIPGEPTFGGTTGTTTETQAEGGTGGGGSWGLLGLLGLLGLANLFRKPAEPVYRDPNTVNTGTGTTRY
jgi:hypothetical protein